MIKNYKCPWCGNEFKRNVNYDAPIDGITKMVRKKSIMSSQVKCPFCCNFIPTWKVELTDNVVGRKHIHIRR